MPLMLRVGALATVTLRAPRQGWPAHDHADERMRRALDRPSGSIGPYPSRVAEEDFTIRLTKDQASVLSEWLDRMMGTSAFDSLVNQERAGEPGHDLVRVRSDRTGAWHL